MARTVDEGFDALLSWLTPTGGETQSAASHRASIDACLTNCFNLTRLFPSGSFGHHTSVSGYSDVDYFAVIPTANLKENSSSTLQAMRTALATRFPKTNVTVRSPAVIVPFGTRLSERHEITPADFVKRSPEGHNIYDIPNRAEGWMRSSPSAHNAWVNRANAKLANRVKPLIRFLKAWNYYRAVGIRSFHLELRTTEYAMGETTIIYKYDVLRVLLHLRQKGLASMQDPMGVSGYVTACTEAAKPGALTKIDTAISRATKALEAEKEGKNQDAFYWWNLLFAEMFPSYR